MAIVDIHAHIYPDKISQRAVDSVRDFYGLEEMYSAEGTAEHLLQAPNAVQNQASITHFCVHSVAVRPKNVLSINKFIADRCAKYPQLIGFMAMHQDCEDPEAAINHGIELGLHGIKIHPDTQRVNADDPRLMNVYEIAQAKKLPIILHVGDYRYNFSHPKRVAKILHAFPDLVVDAAHFGGWSIYDIGFDYLRNENCFVDTSSSFELTGVRHGHELINMFGTDRVMFGSDFPMWDPAKEFDMLCSMSFSEDEFEKLTWHNAENFLGFKIN